MPSSNLETVRAIHRAFLSRDLEAFLAHLDEDVEWGIGAFLTGQATYQGRQGVREWWGEVEALAETQGERLTSEFLDDRELPDGRILSLGKGRIRRAHGDLDTEFAVVYELRNGKVASVSSYPSHAEARADLDLES